MAPGDGGGAREWCPAGARSYILPPGPAIASAPTSTTPPGALDVTCEACGADLVVPAAQRTAQCPYCASPTIVERPPSTDRPQPTFALGFTLTRERAVAIARKWLKSRGVFAHPGIAAGVVELTRGVYAPAYLYGAHVSARYTALIGEDYTVTETYTTTDAKGNTQTRTRTRVETEWRDLAGTYDTYLTDVVVTASRGVPNEELERVEPFDLRALRRYTPAVLAGWAAEEPSMTRAECLALASSEAEERLAHDLADFMPGDSHRSLAFDARLADEVVDLVLLPLWVFAVRYAEGRPPVRIVINGQTGRVRGAVPLSVPRIVLAVVFGLALVAVLVFLFALGGGR